MPESFLYLMRHGRAGLPGILLGQSDPPLTPEGEAEALAWRPFFALHPVNAVWTSPLLRARRTAELALGPHAPPLKEMADLREISLGRWEGLEARQARALFPRIWEARGADPAQAPPGGESFADLARRVLPAFAVLLPQIQALRAALVVAHQAVNRVFLAHVQGRQEMPLSIPQDYARLTILALGQGPVRVLACNCPPSHHFKRKMH